MAKDFHESASMDDQTIFRRQNWYIVRLYNLKPNQKSNGLLLHTTFIFNRIGLYFAWLGFYTKSLVIPSIFGILTVLYGFGTMNTFELNPVT